MVESFKLKILDAAEMLYLRFDNSNEKFFYNLSNNESVKQRIIIKEDKFPNNALFWQILKILSPSNEPDEDKLRNYIVFVDFSNIFQKNYNPDNKTGVMEIFDKSAGINLSFDGKNYKNFVPFDKSNSMSKKCIISFIDSELKDELDRRLTLDIDFSNIPVTLNKYYAYRGLYFSSAKRIETSNAILLNEETVIVLSDFFKDIPQKQKIFTAIQNGDVWDFVSQEKKLEQINIFDGEGLICPEYAEKINDQLRINAHSFQIRLPFTKGVLHEVDFKKFFIEELNYTGSELFIEDIFGHKRDLLKAKIILTESMFKCAGWIKDWKKRPSDPIKYFFEKINFYDHSLYISNTDFGFKSNGRVVLNYQFISTLKLTLQEFNSLVEEQIQKIKSIPNDIKNLASRIANLSFDDFGEFDDEITEKNESIRDKCLKILAYNDAFTKDTKVKTILTKIQDDYEQNICFGKFEVKGRVRFLSGDLLELLIRIAEKTNFFESEKIKELKRLTLNPDRFYMPWLSLPMKHDKYYAFLRNPHLSRNEQCILRAYFRNGENIYEKYFSKLKGIVMVSSSSTVPMALGGADFDGDIVKIISDSRIVEAIKRGAFEEKGKVLKRILPVIEIPSNKAPKEKIPSSIPFRVIENTFDNQVGFISNLAVKLANKEYFPDNPENQGKYANKCAECTIVVGLEIDAAKNGIHPQKNIDELTKIAGTDDDTEKNLFLEAKKFLMSLSEKGGWYTPKLEKTDKSIDLYLTKEDFEAKNKKAFYVPIASDEEGLSPIELLPVRYMQYKVRDFKFEFKTTSEFYFEFEKDKSWRKNLDAKHCEDLKKLVKAFISVKDLAKTVNRSKKWWSNNEGYYDSYINFLLKIQYDAPETFLSCGVKVNQAVEQMYGMFYDIFQDIDQIEYALKLLNETKWHFTEEKKRGENLALILNVEIDTILPAIIELLSTFRDNGFMLLFYVLRKIKVDLKNSLDGGEFISDFRTKKEQSLERLKNFSDSPTEKDTKTEEKIKSEIKKIQRLILKDNEFWNDFYDEYCRASSEKLASSLLDKKIISICRDKVNEIFGGDMNEALKTFWSIKSEDTSRTFFWSIFDTNEILRNLPKKSGENLC